MNKKSLLLSFFFANVALAAPTDCIQLAPDGEVNCIKAKSQFKYAVSNAPLTDTFEETVAAYTSRSTFCSNPNIACYIQYLNDPPEPPGGREITGGAKVSEHTYIDYNTSGNNAARIVTTLYAYSGAGSNTYTKHSMVVYHFRVCPHNTTGVNAGNDTYLRYCKPKVTFKATPCNTGCNQNTGNSNIGN